LPKNIIGIHSETVSSRLYSGNGSSAALVKISPVLVGFCIEDVILKVDAALCENGDGVLGSLWKIDFYLERSSGLAWYIVRNMLRDGVVKVGIPFRVRVLRRVSLSLQDIGLAREAIEVEILLQEVRKNGSRMLQVNVQVQRFCQIRW
jgi:hypothetical protein